MQNRSFGTVIGVYAVVVATLIGCIGVAISAIGGSSVGVSSETRAKSAIESQLESAREIREALAKPIPQPERLGPIASKPAKATPKLATARSAVKRSNADVAMKQGRQAFANIDGPREPHALFGLLSFGPGGRH
jgi:hypothetical protein